MRTLHDRAAGTHHHPKFSNLILFPRSQGSVAMQTSLHSTHQRPGCSPACRAGSGKAILVAGLAGGVCIAAIIGVLLLNRDTPDHPSKAKTQGELNTRQPTEKKTGESNDGTPAGNAEKDATPTVDADIPSTPTATGDLQDEPPKTPAGFDTSGEWSTQRMIALTPSGPFVIDLQVSLGNASLKTAANLMLDTIGASLANPAEPKKQPSDSVMSEIPAGDILPDNAKANENKSEDTDAVADNTPSMTDNATDSANRKNQATSPAENTGEERAETEPLTTKVDGLEETAPKPLQETESSERPLAWADLLDNPLIQAGWLGNLIADDDQQDQLISMYDDQRDDFVSPDEMRRFLSRGLSRRSELQVTDAGESPEAGGSPWGILDENEDYLLDASEWSAAEARLLQLDVDGDSIVTAAEAMSSASTTEEDDAMMQSSLLSSRSMLFPNAPPAELTERERLRGFSSVASKTVQHYSFLAEMPRERWPRCTDARWTRLDLDNSNGLDKYEMRRLVDEPADVVIYVRLPSTSSSDVAEFHAQFQAPENHTAATPNTADEDTTTRQTPSTEPRWHAGINGGRIETRDLSLQLTLSDAFGPGARRGLKARIEAALGSDTLAEQLTTQLQLGDDALDLADRDGDAKLSGAEFARVWNWLAARQSGRLIGRWTLSANPWFQLADADGSGQATGLEMETLADRLGNFDSNGDGQLSSSEPPLVVSLVLSRDDPRLNTPPVVGAPNADSPEPPPQDWFSAMDLNGDGSVGINEFLGESGDFDSLDANKDGILGRAEVYDADDSY